MPCSLATRRGNKRIMRDNVHAKGARPPRHFHANAAKASDAQRLAAQLGTLAAISSPTCRRASVASARQRWRAMRQHHAQRVLRHGHRVGAGRIHHRDALAGGRIQIDVVHAHAGASNYAQLSWHWPAAPRPLAPPSARSARRRTQDAPPAFHPVGRQSEQSTQVLSIVRQPQLRFFRRLQFSSEG